MSNFNEDVLKEQLFILRDFLFHYAIFKGLYRRFDELQNIRSQEFWVYTINAHFYQAINLWCMVFGANNNETHYKKLGITTELKAFIYSELNVTKEAYELYWR